MADGAVVITAGTGTNIDTRTESTNSNHRQVVVLGDPSANAGVAPVDATNGLAVDVKVIAAGDNNIGNVDVVTLPATPAGTNAIGKVVPEGSASGTGLTMFRNTSLSNTAVAVKASSGRAYGWHFYNSGTADSFVQFYDTAQGSVVVGTTTPVKTLWIPSGGAIDGTFGTIPITFATAITIAATTTVAGGSAPGTALLANVDYI